MFAEIVVSGSELVTGRTADGNGPFLAAALSRLGIPCRRITVVGDGYAELVAALREATGRAAVVVVSGGLGPTGDDRTRPAIAEAMGLPLETPPALPHHRAAPLPRGGLQISNPKGSAAGIWLAANGCHLAALPGVPWELIAMWPAMAERIARLPGGRTVAHHTLRTVGLTETEVERTVLMAVSGAPVEVGVTASPLAVDVHLSAATAREIDAVLPQVTAALGERVFGEGDTPLAEVVGGLLRERGLRVAIAESCTGGAIAAALTAISGASDYLDRAVVTYSNRAKSELLGVPAELIERHGAVSAPVARAMAEGLLGRAGVDVALSVTGIAGPTGGSAEKPVGLVFMAVAAPGGTFCGQSHHIGDRERVILRTTRRGLDLLRLYALHGLAALEQAFPSAAR